MSKKCPYCGVELEPFNKKCWCCKKDLTFEIGRGYLTKKEEEQQKVADEIGGAIAVVGILAGFAVIGAVLVGVFKLLTYSFKAIARHKKAILLFLAIVICGFIALFLWFNSPPEQFKIAQKLLASNNSQEVDKGITILKKTVDKSYVPAMLVYAKMQKDGTEKVRKNLNAAFLLYKEIATKDNIEALISLGEFYEYGIATKQNLVEANNCYRKAVELGSVKAKEKLDKIKEIVKFWKPAHVGNGEAQYFLGVCYLNGNGIEKNDEIARQWITKSADSGFAKAQVELCDFMIKGQGGPQNVALGIMYCEKAAKQNYPEAFTELGKYYFEGKVINQNYDKAILYYTKAIEFGSANSAFRLGYCYSKGLGCPKDIEKAFKYFSIASKRNSLEGNFILGECYENGIGTNVNYTEALNAYNLSSKKLWNSQLIKKSEIDAKNGVKRLAEIGKWWNLANKEQDAEAQCRVGVCYFTGNGVKKNEVMALSWFKKSAEQNYLEAIVRVADCQFYGYGIVKNEIEAVKTYSDAANKGDAHAMYRLGECFEHGTGVKQNLTTAYNWYKKAIDANYATAIDVAKKIEEVASYWDEAIKNNNVKAQFLLANAYKFGDKGIPKNLKKSFEWYKKSAEQGYIKAIHNLGFCYLNGDGTEQNIELMKKCFLKGAENNFTPSISTLGELYQKGIGFEQNLTTAYEYFLIASKSQDKYSIEQIKFIENIAKHWASAYNGSAQSQYDLAYCYFKGDGIDKNYDLFEEWLLKSANNNYANAQYDLANFYEINKKNNKDIIPLLNKAVINGHIAAMTKLGECYYFEKGIDKDLDKAIELWESAAKANNSDAMYFLGNYRFSGRGMFNSGKDTDKAILYWQKASDLGHLDATFKLANYYKEGTGMFSSGKDIKKAFELYEKAAHGGHAEAMFKLGKALYEGDDIKKDKQRGITLLKQSANAENKDATKYINNKNIK